MTLTRSIDRHLGEVGLLCFVILIGILLHRIIRIFTNTLISAIIAIEYSDVYLDASKSAIQKFAHNSLLAHALNFVVIILNNCVHIAIVFLRALFFVLYVLLPLVIIAISLIIINERWSDFLIFVANVYNEQIANILQAIVVFPMDVIDLILSSFLPIFNFFVFILIQIPIQIFFWVANGEAKDHFVTCIKFIASAFPAFAEEMKRFANQNAVDCKHLLNKGNFYVIAQANQVCSNSTNFHQGFTQCVFLSSSDQAENCFDPSKRSANFMNVFGHFQQAAAHGILSIGSSCQFLNTIVNVTLYPLVDPALWNTMDRVGNAVLHAFTTVPVMTLQRCNLAGGFAKRPAMCTPDFGPSFDYLIEASLYLGTLLTNWIDVFYLFIFDTKDGELYSTCSKKSDYAEIFQSEARKLVLGSNATVLVRLTSLDFALTDGTSAIFINERGSMRRSYAVHAWPISANPKYGIARSFLPTGKTVNDNGIGMFGCTCQSTATGYVKMECAIVTKTGTSWVLPVDWSLSSQTQLMTCSRMRVVVQSIRWPQKRVFVEDLTQGSSACEDCLVGDVAVYVVPICGSTDGIKSLACLPERYFTRGMCFPYCMALHTKNELQRPLMMRGASEWEQGVFMANRDCVPNVKGTATASSAQSSNTESSCRIDSGQAIKMETSAKTIGNVQSSDSCYFSVSCSSTVSDKGVLATYKPNILSGYVPVITDSFSVDRGARLTLDLQPLVIAGGVHMRRYNPNPSDKFWIDANSKEDYVVDFPTLVGDQYNEFTMEMHGSLGIPVAPRASVPSEERNVANAHKGKVFLPQALDYVQKYIPFSPATLSSDALWYGTNPSYDWIKAMISYCATGGFLAYTQVQFLSSYSPMRLWKIQYKRSSCYIEGVNLIKTCSPNVSKSFSIDPPNEIPILSSSVDNSDNLYSLCVSKKTINVWIESLEDFDEFNIVIAVRRASMQDMGFLMDTLQESEYGDVPTLMTRGESVFYFFSKFSEKIRENIPWTEKEFMGEIQQFTAPSISFLDMSCPKLRVLPNIGSFIGHSMAASIYLFKIPINFVANPFAIQEMIAARTNYRCPENSMKHSALQDCGMSLISLHHFFAHVYQSNEAFWDMISWLVFVVSGGSTDANLSPESLIFSQFLQGAVVLGEATKLVAYMDITRSVEFMDTGVENVLFRTRRRRLLQEGGGETAEKPATKASFFSRFSNMAGYAKNGVGSVLSAIKSFAMSVFTNLFSGADVGALISTQNPITSVITVSVTVPPIAWAEMTYESVTPIILDILSFAVNKQFSLKPLWVHMYDTMDRYDEIIHERHKRGCMGFRLMFGFSSSTAKALYYNCLAVAEMPRGIWTMILTIFVDMNLYRCLCVYPAGKNYAENTLERCEYLMSPNRKGLWQKLLASRSVENLCSEYSMTIESQMYGAFNDWYALSFQAAEASTNFFDELFIKRTQSMECNNIQNNPTAVVLTPTPLYHYQVCTQTSSCKERCADTFLAFESEYKRIERYGTAMEVTNFYNHEIESPMYNMFANEWTNANSLYVYGRRFVVTFLTENVADISRFDAPCKVKCSSDPHAKCAKTLVEILNSREYEISVFCLPGPGSVLKSMYNIEQYTLSDIKKNILLSAQDIVTHVEFSIQNVTWTASTYLFMYVTKKQTQVIDNQQTFVDQNEVILWKTREQGGATSTSILKSSDLGDFLNHNNMMRALYGPSVELSNIQILSLNILTVQEFCSEVQGMFVLLFSFEVQVKANKRLRRQSLLDLESRVEDTSESFRIFGKRMYCDDHPDCMDSEGLVFYVPCDVCANVAENEYCYQTCNSQMDAIFEYLNHGNLLHLRKNTYLFMPGKSNFGDDSIFLFETFLKTSRVLTIAIESMQVNVLNTYSLNEDSTQTMDILGNWDRSKVFWTNSIMSKPIRDVKFYLERYPVYFISTTGGGRTQSLNTEWLQQARFEFQSGSFVLTKKKSLLFNTTSTLKINCKVHSCAGCPTSKLKLLCAAAQDCTLVKCIGSVIQTKNMFCGLGNIFEKMASHSILTWRALYLSMAEIMLIIMRGLIGDIVKEVSLKFPTDQFYTLVCACKDTYASYVGFGISVIQMISSGIFGSSGLIQGLSLIQNNDMVGALVGEQILKISSIGSLVFNMMAGSTLLPTLALHKWLICITNSTLMQETSGDFKLVLDDTVMDTSWIKCARLDGFTEIMNSLEIKNSLESTIDMFVQFSKSLVTGLGETILYGMQLSWHAIMDFYIGLVWNFQDILFTFNLKQCKVPNYALRYVLRCACNDAIYRIPATSRRQGTTDGALWCAGTLNVNLLDGTPNAIIYNPYPLEVLSEGLRDVNMYVKCLSENREASLCDSYKSLYNTKLQVLVNQNVEPLVVWTKCKSNYLHNTWDSAAGALFMQFEQLYDTDSKNPFLYAVTDSLRSQMIEWAKGISLEFLNCMQNPSRLRMDYSSCMQIFFDVKQNQRPSAYFVYDEQLTAGQPNDEPPDACSVFSGIGRSGYMEAANVTNVFKECLNEEISLLDTEISSCKLNPSIWSTSQSSKTSVAKLHGNRVPWSNNDQALKKKMASEMYAKSREKLMSVWRAFNESFPKEKQSIDVQLFSADGDFIHEFFDCMYLGPYSRVDMFPCTSDELECPFYARDEEGGKSREFTPCLGDVTYNDSKSPYTCGSRGRRSIIKYFFRDIWSAQHLSLNVSEKVFKKVTAIFQNYTSESSVYCYNSTTGQCTLEACSLRNGFQPCLDTDYNIDEQEMSKFIIDVILGKMDAYYAQTMQDTEPWTLYAGNSGPLRDGKKTHPFQWNEKRALALNEGFLTPSEPILKYDNDDVFVIPTPNVSSSNGGGGMSKERRLSSLWSLCMALLAQPSMSVAIENRTWNSSSESVEIPVGMWEYLLQNGFYSETYMSKLKDTFDTNNLTSIEAMIQAIVQKNMKSHNPFVWHKSKRHAPSKSTFCKTASETSAQKQPPGKIQLTNAELNIRTDEKIVFQSENAQNHFLHFGYQSRTIGESSHECVCGFRFEQDLTSCKVFEETCASLNVSRLRNERLKTFLPCKPLWDACNGAHRVYAYDQRHSVFECLHALENTVRCPELQLSDTWGFYPVDCSDRECMVAENWQGRGNFVPEYSLMRFVNEGRGGMRLTSYAHHNQTFHHQINYHSKQANSSHYEIPRCFEEAANDDDDTVNLVDNYLKHLFPAVQMVHESHVIAYCSRFVVETARVQILETIDPTIVEEFTVQALTWKRKCHNKIRQLSACSMMGVYFDVPPPADWEILLSREKCGIEILNVHADVKTFMTPWCILVNQTSKKIYNAHVCCKNKDTYPSSSQNPEFTPWIDLGKDRLQDLNCEVQPSPFDFLRENPLETVPLSMLYYHDESGKNTLLPEENWIEEMFPGMTLETLHQHATVSNSENSDYVSHVLDWWPEDILNFPVGFHPTASTDPEELAPAVLDSQFLYDASAHVLFYIHTSLRNASLFHENLGSCGICRSTTVGMPMFETNTNRLCTRLSKHANEDIPTFPVYQIKNGGGNSDFTQWPFSDEFIEQHFEPEQCTEESTDIPWIQHPHDHLSKTAGSIPGWIYTASMESDGTTWFNQQSSIEYPPTAGFEAHEINEPKIFGNDQDVKSWGPCAEVVKWKATSECDVEDASKTCPDFRSSCLRVSEGGTLGICYPNIVYASSILSNNGESPRYPCFASFHCPKNQVCLADGGCAPLYLHVWNNDVDPVEVTVLADTCDFEQSNHPYTQSTRGASPWENIPDIFDMHGFCSKHNWFSFRHSLNIDLDFCSMQQSTDQVKYMLCHANTTHWPWIIEKFDKTTPSSGNSKSMMQEETLKMHPNVCDQTFMHLRNPWTHKRFAVCSGYEGQQRSIDSDAYLRYPLAESSSSWTNVDVRFPFNQPSTAPDSDQAWWMRSYVEETDEVAIGTLQYDRNAQNKALGFLGADERLNNAIRELTYDNEDKSKFNFIKCVDKIKCRMPEFTFNGIQVMRLDMTVFPSKVQNHTEMSLRLCGAIGYVNTTKSNKLCVLDMQLFPLVSYMLWASATTSCSAILWTKEEFKEAFRIVMVDEDDAFEKLTAVERTNLLHCNTKAQQCVFSTRNSDTITEANANDHITALTDNLNEVITSSASQIVRSIIFTRTSSMVYEHIHQCIDRIYRHTLVVQRSIQRHYQAAEPSGIYLGTRLTLIEIPLAWLQHAWLVALASTFVQQVRMPNLEVMLASGDFDLPMWGGSGCQELERSTNNNFLIHVLCREKYVKFAAQEEDFVEVRTSFVERLKGLITDNVISKLMIQKENINVKCFKKARRNCYMFRDRADYEKCMKALYFVHNTTSEKDTAPDSINTCVKTLTKGETPRDEVAKLGVNMSFLDPCTNHSLFELLEEVSLPTEYLDRYVGYGSTLNDIINSLTTMLRQLLTSKINVIIQDVNYVQQQVLSASQHVDIMKVKSFDEYIQIQKNTNLDFDLTEYFEKTVCQSKFQAEDFHHLCKFQADIQSNEPCLFENADVNREYFKFADDNSKVVQDNKNIITITYKNQDTQTIDVCEVLSHHMATEACFVQYLGDTEKISDLQIVECDIQEIYVPPGIEVQVFGYTGTEKTEWQSILQRMNHKVDKSDGMCNASNPKVRACTLRYDLLTQKSTNENAWWFGSFKTTGLTSEKVWRESYMDRSTRFEMEFGDINNWWSTGRTEWESNGCYNIGVCAIKIRLEDIPRESKTGCLRAIPECRNYVSNRENLRPYTLLPSGVSPALSGSLMRCAPCIRKNANVFNSDGLFGCQMRDSNNMPIQSIAESLSEESLRQKMPFLYSSEAMRTMVGSNSSHISFADQENKIAVRADIGDKSPMLKKYEETWGRRDFEDLCLQCPAEPIDVSEFRMTDETLWNELVANPTKNNIMVCNEQKLEVTDLQECNPSVDARRMHLKEFADKVYRKRNGVWMPKIAPGEGLAWKASVANANVTMFSLMFASSVRETKLVKTKHVLSNDVCASKQSSLTDKICVESKANSQWKIEIMNPWLGGNFNPFHGPRGLDECYTDNGNDNRKILCKCECDPPEHCKDPKNIYQGYTQEFLNSEFRPEEDCTQRAFPQFHVLSENDETNLCHLARKELSGSICYHKQGLFGGQNLFYARERVSFTDLHDKRGYATDEKDYLTQAMLDENNNGLWKGNSIHEESNEKQYAFLKMPRMHPHPAHIAFSFDHTKTGSPLLIQAVALLPYRNRPMPASLRKPREWLDSLPAQFQQDYEVVMKTYPNFEGLVETGNAKGHWSCPYRKLTFWTQTQNPLFSPKVPNPLVTKILFSQFQKMHPLVQLTDAGDKLKDYKTTNGLCFYEDLSNGRVSLEDATNPCGLKQIFKQYMDQKYALSRVMTHFHDRCMDIIDFPGLNATLRSGEIIDDANQVTNQAKCGVLHRLTPFLMRTAGNKAMLQKNRDALYTHSEGGDCHMGRAFKYAFAKRSDLAGKQCLLAVKTKDRGVVKCEGIAFSANENSAREYVLERTRPLKAYEIAGKKIRKFKRDRSKKRSVPAFAGPGASTTQELSTPETSFGLLYSSSLAQVLADDLVSICKARGCRAKGPWRPREFLKHYREARSSALLDFAQPQDGSGATANTLKLKDILFKGLIFAGNNDSLSEFLNAKLKHQDLWSLERNWTWSYYTKQTSEGQKNATTIVRKFVGNVKYDSWRANRFKACNTSYYETVFPNKDAKIDFTTMRVTLCEPAPTGSLQELCKALLQFNDEIKLANCQLAGNNDCMYKPSMFYLPYEWSTTNQQFASETVRNYYEQVFKTYTTNSGLDFSTQCPAYSILDSKLIQLSKETEKACPANKINYLKDALESVKTLGTRLLYLAYCLLMFAVNILAMFFAKSGAAATEMFETAMLYAGFFFEEIAAIAMPLLNTFLKLIFGVSEAGKVFAEILKFLCQRFNATLDFLVYTIWCPIVLPALYNWISLIKVAFFYVPQVGTEMDKIWNAISRGQSHGYDIKACIANFGPRVPCTFDDNAGKFNDTTFSTQPFATRCWVDSQLKSGYSNIFSGSTDFAYLACTVGDTCALDSTAFDDYYSSERLVPCASCPPIQLADGQSFGCNTYLKRCTCSTSIKSISNCLSNQDCSSSEAICSMATSIDTARSSAASMRCSTCGQLNQDSICVMDGRDNLGVCVCASVQQTSFLQTCSEASSGGVSLIDPTKQCFVSNNQNFINIDDVTVQMDFSDLAVGPCVLGKVQRQNILCMRVTLPLSSAAASITKTFVVLVNFQATSQSFITTLLNPTEGAGRRRLLSVPQNRTLSQCISSASADRVRVKECIHALEMAEILANWHGIESFKANPTLLLNAPKLWFLNEDLRHEVTAQDKDLAFKFLVDNVNGPGFHEVWTGAQDIITTLIKTFAVNSSRRSHSMSEPLPSSHQRRKLLQVTNIEQEQGRESFRCKSLESVLYEISQVFWITVSFYDNKMYNFSVHKSPIFFYNFPSFENDSAPPAQTLYNLMAYQAVSLLFSGGTVEGSRILKSFVANISEEESVEKNYFTGKRFLADISKCNYSKLTFGPDPPRSVLPWFSILFVVFFLIATCLSSSNIVSFLLWVVVFPIVLLWSLYNVSPLCFPMIPPKLPHDLIAEVKAMIPSKIDIPYFLVKSACLPYKRVTNRTISKLVPDGARVLQTLNGISSSSNSDCFKKCSDSPFLMKSWQDPMAWWLCEMSTAGCRKVASFTEKIGLLRDFTSSSYYFAKVVDMLELDPDFVKAHRFCALFTTHEVIVSGMLMLTVLLATPSLIQSAFDIFLNAIVLIIHANNAENLD